jgi:hypothetical protein
LSVGELKITGRAVSFDEIYWRRSLMLKVRKEQMETFRMQMQARFVLRMVDYLRVTFPAQTKNLTDDHLRETVQQGERKAQDYGVVYEDDIRRFLGYVVVYGLTLDSHPQTQWIADILHRHDIDGTVKMDFLDDYELRVTKDQR